MPPEDETKAEEPSDTSSEVRWPLLAGLLGSALLHALVVFGGPMIADLLPDLTPSVEWTRAPQQLEMIGSFAPQRTARTAPESSEDKSSQPDRQVSGELEPQEGPEAFEEAFKPKKPSRLTQEPTEPARPKNVSEAPPQAPSNEPALPELDRAGPSNLPDLSGFAPGNALMSALIRMKPLRGQPYESQAKRLLERLPDYHILAEASDVEPTRVMDSFFMASSNPRYVQRTFLAIRHNRTNEEIRRILDRRYPDPPTWDTVRGMPRRDLIPETRGYRDNRNILLADDQTLVVARDQWLDTLLGESDDAPMLEALRHVHETAEDDQTIALLSATGLRYRIPGLRPLTFESVRLAIRKPETPTLQVDLKLPSTTDARDFVDACPSMRDAIKRAVPGSYFIGLDALIDRLTCRVDGTYAHISATYQPEQMRRLLNLATMAIPHPPSLARLPAPPQRETESR
jgi:hypothetical protein